MEEMNIGNSALKSLTFGMHDAVSDGVLMRDIPARLVFVKNETERDALEGLLPGTFVVTYGLMNVWQYDGDGTWKAIK